MPKPLTSLGKRLLHFRLRTLMIAVAVVALPLATWARIEARREQFRRASAYHRDQVVGAITVAIGPPGSYGVAAWSTKFRCRLSQAQVDLDMWHLGLSKKYEEAAERPWLPVAADPDPPGL